MVLAGGVVNNGASSTGPEHDRKTPRDSEDGRRRDFTERLSRLRDARRPVTKGNQGTAGYAQALRLSTEFGSALLVGAGLGWAVDYGLGTAPWGMIILLLLGFCAGIVNVLRAAGKVSDPHKGGLPPSTDEKGD